MAIVTFKNVFDNIIFKKIIIIHLYQFMHFSLTLINDFYSLPINLDGKIY
jgi:hypothetical protein